jgi:hypothetical protein
MSGVKNITFKVFLTELAQLCVCTLIKCFEVVEDNLTHANGVCCLGVCILV